MDNQVVTISAQTSKTQSNYFDFVDGLRAIAVLSVILYHAGVPWISGGFVGVDVFFVISGFLIIGQIVSGLQRRKFSFSEFWSRRALRILPSYLLVILFCSIVAPFILVMPGEYEAFANEVAYSALMVANHLFLGQQGYFDTGADTKVLLHLWSLAVEEQFYIVTPLLLALVWRFRRIMPIVATVIFFVSLAGCIYWTGLEGDKNYSFYVMPLRAWEFIAGGSVSVAAVYASRLPRAGIEILAIAGVGAIAYAVLTFDHTTPFPSYWAVIPVFGSCAIILAGLAGQNIVKWILATRPMVSIGLISYAWYLWHWPLLVFGRIYNFGDHIPYVDGASVVLSFLLAVATYFGVERPIRSARERRGKPLGWLPTGVGLSACLVACVGGYLLFTAQAQTIATSLAGTLLPDRPGSAGVCDLRWRKSLDQCREKYAGRPFGILIGDSQADAATRGLVDVIAKHGAGLATVASGGCISFIPATTRIPDTKMAENCHQSRANAQLLLKESGGADFAILYSRWTLYADPKSPYYFIDGDKKKDGDQRSAFISSMRVTLSYLRSIGVSRILIVGPTPIFPRSAPECVVRSLHYGQSPDERCSEDARDEIKRRALAMEWLHAAIADQTDVELFDPFQVFCDDTLCRPYAGDSVLFNDTNHVSDAGVRAIHDAFPREFAWATLEGQALKSKPF